MMMDDELFARAARKAAGQMLEELPSGEQPEHQFSETFEKKMEKMLRSQRRPQWQRSLGRISRRAAVLALVAFVGLSACLMGVEAWRAQFFQMVEEKFPDHSRITFENTSGREVPEGPFIPYEITDIPDGFTCTQFSYSDFFNYAVYEDGEEHMISFDQNRIDSIAIGLNTEGASLEPITLNGEPAQFLSNLGMQTVLWYDDQYCFMLTSDLPREETLRIAGSVRVKNVPEGLPSGFDADMAADRGDVVLAPEDNRNLDKLDRFMKNFAAGVPDEITLSIFTGTGGIRLRSLAYDGSKITFYRDDSFDKESDQPWVQQEDFDSIEIAEEPLDGRTTYIINLYSSHYDHPTEVASYR